MLRLSGAEGTAGGGSKRGKPGPDDDTKPS